jgi:hypothetical protein
MSQLGIVLRKTRVSCFMTIGDLSMKTGAHPGLIGNLERGYIPARCGWFSDLERALGLPKDFLVKLHQLDASTDIVAYSVKDLNAGRKQRRDAPTKIKNIRYDRMLRSTGD